MSRNTSIICPQISKSVSQLEWTWLKRVIVGVSFLIFFYFDEFYECYFSPVLLLSFCFLTILTKKKFCFNNFVNLKLIFVDYKRKMSRWNIYLGSWMFPCIIILSMFAIYRYLTDWTKLLKEIKSMLWWLRVWSVSVVCNWCLHESCFPVRILCMTKPNVLLFYQWYSLLMKSSLPQSIQPTKFLNSWRYLNRSCKVIPACS